MDVRKEFVNRVNDAVDSKRKAEPGNRIVVIIPVPKTFSIDCNDTSGIELGDVKIRLLGDGAVKDEKGNVLLDAETARSMGANFYEVCGLAK